MKVARVITTIGEITLDLCKEAMEKQTYVVDTPIHIIRNVYPMRTAFNAALDYAWENKADVLLHVAADAIVVPDALEKLIAALTDDVFLVCSRSRDALKIKGCGPWIFHTKLIQDKYRYGKGQIADVDFAERVVKETGWEMVIVDEQLCVHHPIWTPKDLFMRLRFSLPKYRVVRFWYVVEKYRQFFVNGLKEDMNNVTLIMGYDFFNQMNIDLEKYVIDDKDPRELEIEWDAFRANYPPLTGREFWAMEEYREIAKGLLS